MAELPDTLTQLMNGFKFPDIRWFLKKLVGSQPPIILTLDQQPILNGFSPLTGWAVSRLGPIEKIEASVGGTVIAAGRPSEERPDVKKAFPHFVFHDWIGFRLTFEDIGLGPGTYPLNVTATDAQGHLSTIQRTLRVTESHDLMRRLPPEMAADDREYQLWQKYHDPQFDQDTGDLLFHPTIDVLMRVQQPRLKWLGESVAALQGQLYDNWQLFISCSDQDLIQIQSYLEREGNRDNRINLTDARPVELLHDTTHGKFFCFLGQHDVLSPHSLLAVVKQLQSRHPPALVYADEDQIDSSGYRVQPILKPDWSPELLQATNYLGRLCVFDAESVVLPNGDIHPDELERELGRSIVHSVRDVVHIPLVLYHRRGWNGSERSSPRTMLKLSDPPRISILIPTKNNVTLLQQCLSRIREKTTYGNYEIIIIDNGSDDSATVELLRTCGAEVIRMDVPFNHSRLTNHAARRATGDLLLLLNDDTEVLEPSWLEWMATEAVRPSVGAVGARLFFPDGRLQHAGIVMGVGGVPAPVSDTILNSGSKSLYSDHRRAVSAVTGACLMIRKEVYFEAGGLDEEDLPTVYNDADLCLKLNKLGYENIFVPEARLIHHESATRPLKFDWEYVGIMQDRWGEDLLQDPYWNPQLPGGPFFNPSLSFRWQNGPCAQPSGASKRSLLSRLLH